MTFTPQVADEAGGHNLLEHTAFTLVYGDSCVW
jgi:hypothetical protein